MQVIEPPGKRQIRDGTDKSPKTGHVCDAKFVRREVVGWRIRYVGCASGSDFIGYDGQR